MAFPIRKALIAAFCSMAVASCGGKVSETGGTGGTSHPGGGGGGLPTGGSGGTPASGGQGGTPIAGGGSGPGGFGGAPCGPEMKGCGGGLCVSTDDPKYSCAVTSCAPCGLAHATATCHAGACAIGKCDPGYADCNGVASDGCEADLLNDSGNCGGCHAACASSGTACVSCIQGTCAFPQCPVGRTDCNCDPADGCETDLEKDPANCGFCGHACSSTHVTEACEFGNCVVVSCDKDWGNCDGQAFNGCETHIRDNVKNCGKCGNVCPPQAVCGAGVCI